MGREIKFRAWHKDCMKYSGNGYELATLFDYFLLDEDTFLMQSTGLTDKNLKEIYEGDIISAQYEVDGNIEKSNLEVFFCEKKAQFALDFSYDKDRSFVISLFEEVETEEYEIIGNIFENPELLTK